MATTLTDLNDILKTVWLPHIQSWMGRGTSLWWDDWIDGFSGWMREEGMQGF